MLYTRQGDGGTTKVLHCDQRLSKSSAIAEALGAVDELNSLLLYALARLANYESDITEQAPHYK
ncbi:MAG TPA: ATP:cob(I)alamin adenosyltransferase [Candidatus Paceibacterota bacterium]